MATPSPSLGSPLSPPPSARADELSNGIALLRRLVPERDIGRHLDHLLGTAEQRARLDERTLDELEEEVVRLGDAVPPAVFRARFHRELVPTDVQLAYCRLLARHPEVEERCERLELIATRLLSVPLPDGQLEVLDEAAFVRVLARVLPKEVASAERRAAAVGFFTDAAERLAGFSGVYDLFHSGFYVDLKAYRSTLGRDRTDPAVLYASVLLDIALTNHLVRFTKEAHAAEDQARNDEADLRHLLRGATAAVMAVKALDWADPRLATALSEAEAILERLGELTTPAETQAELKRRLKHLVEAALEIDDKLDPAWLRGALATQSAPPETLTRYAAFLVEHPGGPARRARAEAVVTHLVTEPDESDRTLRARSDEVFLSVLGRVCPRPLADEAQRASAMTFFLDAARKLPHFASFDDLFDSGLYLNLIGYRRALGWAGLDPGVLYASILVDVAIVKHVARFLADEAVPLARMQARADDAEREVARIFAEDERLAREGEETFEVQLDRYIQILRNFDGSEVLADGRTRTYGYLEQRPLRKRQRRVAILAAAILAAAIPLANVAARDENTLREANLARVQLISPFLASGSFSEGEGPKVFVGRVDEDRWQVASPAERRQAARTIAEKLLSQNVVAALLYKETELVLHIDEGEILLVR